MIQDAPTSEELADRGFSYVRHLFQTEPLISVYWKAVSEHIIVTNRLDAHVGHDDKPLMIYYWCKIDDPVGLRQMRNLIMLTWFDNIRADWQPSAPVAGMHRGMLAGSSQVCLEPQFYNGLRTRAVERDEAYYRGYNPINAPVGMPPCIWGNLIWRYGQVARPGWEELKSRYGSRNIACPLALGELATLADLREAELRYRGY